MHERGESVRFTVNGDDIMAEEAKLDANRTSHEPSVSIAVEPLADGIGGDHVGYWTGSHVPKRKFIGACLNAYKHDFGDDVTGLFQSEVKQAHWRESHDCYACASEVEAGYPPDPECSTCKGTGQMYDYMLLPAKPDEPGAFPVTYVYFE